MCKNVNTFEQFMNDLMPKTTKITKQKRRQIKIVKTNFMRLCEFFENFY